MICPWIGPWVAQVMLLHLAESKYAWRHVAARDGAPSPYTRDYFKCLEVASHGS